MSALARRIEERTTHLAAASVEGLYADPFWFARYGEARARRFGSEDAVFHVRYLVQALDTADAGVMERYARWLQGLLVPRGMCSHHIQAHFQGLHRALVDEDIPEPAAALDYLHAASRALRWPGGPARLVREALPGLVPTTLRALDAPEAGPEDTLREEVVLQLSYLQDSLGTGRSGLFVDHVRWYADFWPQRGLRCDYRALLRAVETALAQDAHLAELPRVTVAMGLTALEEEHP